jgi:hypothetical protein
MHVAQLVGWAVALAALAGALFYRLATHWRRCLVGLVLIWSALPGEASPVFWLGLAFQLPSIVGVFLAGATLLSTLQLQTGGDGAPARPQPNRSKQSGLALAGVMLGYALLLDTFAQLPVQLYAWGYSPLAVAVVALVSLAPWVLGQSTRGARILACTVALFVLTRLPTGNVWDAVLDPLTWLVLQGHVLRSALMARRRLAIRA